MRRGLALLCALAVAAVSMNHAVPVRAEESVRTVGDLVDGGTVVWEDDMSGELTAAETESAKLYWGQDGQVLGNWSSVWESKPYTANLNGSPILSFEEGENGEDTRSIHFSAENNDGRITVDMPGTTRIPLDFTKNYLVHVRVKLENVAGNPGQSTHGFSITAKTKDSGVNVQGERLTGTTEDGWTDYIVPLNTSGVASTDSQMWLTMWFEYISGDVWIDSVRVIQEYSLHVAAQNVGLNVGDTYKMEVTSDSQDMDLSGLTYESSASDVASVDTNGTVTAHQAGTAVITAKLDDSHTVSCTVTVEDPDAPTPAGQERIWSDGLEETTTVSGTAASYWENKTAPKNWTGFWQAASFTTQNAKLSLDTAAFASGTQSIHYSSTDNTGRISVSLGTKLQDMDFANTNYILRAKVKADNVVPASGKTGGFYMRAEAGTAGGSTSVINPEGSRVTGTTSGWITYEVPLRNIEQTVKADNGQLLISMFFDYFTGDVWIDDIELWKDYRLFFTEENLVLEPNEEHDLEVKCSADDVDLSQITYESSNPEVVSVDENGKITALKYGAATITAMMDDAHTVSCKVQVDSEELKEQYASMRTLWVNRLTGNGTSLEGDQDFAAMMDKLAKDAKDAMEAMTELPGDGSMGATLWTDLKLTINFVQGSSDPLLSSPFTTAYTRLQTMATAYAAENCGLTEDERTELKEHVLYGLEWLYKNGYNENYDVEKKLYGNWWDWEIGVPQALASTVILMYEDLSQDEINKYYATLKHFNEDPTYVWKISGYGKMEMTSANLMDTSLVAALRSAIGNDQDGIAAAVNALGTATEYATGEEGNLDGFYKDGSCIQHSNLAYTGGYGVTLLKGIEKILLLSNGTAWQLPSEKLSTVYSWIWDGYRPIFANGVVMDMVSGRSVARPSHTELETARGILSAIVLLAENAPEDIKGDLLSFAKLHLQAGAEMSDEYFSGMDSASMVAAKQLVADGSVTAADGTPYTKIFGSMDKAAVHREDFTLGISMYSSRTGNFEWLNGENKKGWHMSDGALFLYNGDEAQFSNNYWNTIDAHRLPGTTTDHSEGVLYGTSELAHTSSKDYVGGSTVEGMYATIAMDFEAQSGSDPEDQTNLTAKKAWFAFDDEVVALGTDIQGITKFTETIIENKQISENGSNTLIIDGQEMQSGFGESSAPGARYAWIEGNNSADNIGYYFPDGEDLNILKETKTGSFKDINTSVKDGDAGSEESTRNYLSLAVSHGDGTTAGAEDYAYVLLPGMNAEETAAYAEGAGIEILANNSTVQAVRDASSGASGYQFWAAGEIENVKADQPVSVTLKEDQGRLHIGISDPSQTQSSLTVYLRGYEGLSAINSPAGVITEQDGEWLKITVDIAGLELTDGATFSELELSYTYVPEDTEEPTDPSNPGGSTDPSEPTEPSNPDGSTEPSEPTDPSNPGGSPDPSEPTDPSNPGGSTDPSEPTDPSNPGGSTDPSEPTDPSNSGNPTGTETDKIIEEIRSAQSGSEIIVNMGSNTVVSADVLEAAKGKDVNIVLKMDGYTWTINGKDITAAQLKNVDLRVIEDVNVIPDEVIKKLAGDRPTKQISLVHEGPFGFAAELTIYAGKEYTGQYGNIFWYTDDKMVFIDSSKVVEDGYVSFTFTHASDYVIVMSEQAMSAADIPAELRAEDQGGLPKTGDHSDVLLYVVLMAAAAAGIVVALRRMRYKRSV